MINYLYGFSTEEIPMSVTGAESQWFFKKKVKKQFSFPQPALSHNITSYCTAFQSILDLKLLWRNTDSHFISTDLRVYVISPVNTCLHIIHLC